MSKRYYLDMLERVAWTFVQAIAGYLIAVKGFGADAWVGALTAGGLAVAKALVAGQIGKKTAALPDPPE